MGQQLLFSCKLKLYKCRRSENESEKGVKYEERDPKPSDLLMNRLKLVVKDRGGPNSRMWKNAGMICE